MTTQELETELRETQEHLALIDKEVRYGTILLVAIVDHLFGRTDPMTLEIKRPEPAEVLGARNDVVGLIAERKAFVEKFQERKRSRIPTQRTSEPGVFVKQNGGTTRDGFEPGM